MHHEGMTASRLGHTLATFVTAGLVLAGTVLLVLGSSPSAGFGWVAYTPLNGPLPTAAWAFFNWQQRVGAGLVVAGLVAMAGDVGYRFGRSRGVSAD